MNDLPTQSVLDLEVTDFGPIVKAKVDLRPLTVLIGPSNTGKSYLAILIYALHRYFSRGGWPRRGSFLRNHLMHSSIRAKNIAKKTIDDLNELGIEILAYKRRDLSEKGIVLPSSITDVISYGFGEQGEFIGNEISRCFGIENTGSLIRKEVKGPAYIAFRKHNGSNSSVIDHRLEISAQKSDFKTIIPKNTQMRIMDVNMNDDHLVKRFQYLLMETSLSVKIKEERTRFLLDSLAEYIHPQIFGLLDLPAFYLPADRTGVMHAHSVVVSTLIESAAMTGLRPAARTPMLSGVLADFLEQLIELDRSPRRNKSQRNHGTWIEKAILGGSVRVEKSAAIDYPHFTYKPDGWKDSLPLMNASSMVSELAPVVLYLRHVVRPENVLIIEEPESHLHPAMQVEFTRQIAVLVKSGIRVIITTHSELVIEELANIVRRFNLPTPDQNATTNTKIALHSGQVGAWLFKQKDHPKGSVVEEVILDDETGLYPTGFDDVNEELYNESVNIFSRTQQNNDT